MYDENEINLLVQARDFVKYRKGQFKGSIEIKQNTPYPVVSIVIPTRDAWGRGWFPKLVKQIEGQTFKDWELIIVKGDTIQARAINSGVAVSRGKYILTLDDDSQLPQKETIENMVRAMESDDKIGAVGAGRPIPPYANWLSKRMMMEISRNTLPVVEEITDSIVAEHGCLLLRKKAFLQIGGENEFLFRGDDSYLCDTIRKAGYRVVIAPKTYYYHLPPHTLRGFLKFAIRNGRGSAIIQKLYPQWVYDNPDEHRMDVDFQPSFPKRLLRAIKTTFFAFLLFRPIYIIYRFFYTIGYIWGWLRPKVPD
ncbi:glycosyltransferase [bacterium]|nr:glycosyltransferase [bacterium]